MIENKKRKIIHYAIEKDGWLKTLYLCNQAVGPAENKLTKDWDMVTCKNCLKQRKKVQK